MDNAEKENKKIKGKKENNKKDWKIQNIPSGCVYKKGRPNVFTH